MKKENKLIAEFMGMSQGKPNENRWKNDWFEKLTTDGNEFESGRRHEHLLFDSSWEWLMPVVDKIEELEYFVHVLGDGCIIYDGECPKIIRTGSRKEATYKAVVEFIKWYNENNEK